MTHSNNWLAKFYVALLVSLFTSVVLPVTANAQQNPEPLNKPIDTTEQLPHTILRLPNVHPGREQLYDYAKNLLTEVLDVTAPVYGSYKIQISDIYTSQSRQLRNLEHNLLDVTWTMSSKERERQFLPIRIPIMAGLLGKRALLVKENDSRLQLVNVKDDLTAFRAVLGYDWPDTKIFRASNIEVLETTYQASFRIVSEGFADFFPRSVLEVKEELSNEKLTAGLTIDNHVIISYPSPIFFFVNSSNTALATRISEGLLILFESGRFKSLLEAHSGYIEAMELIGSRRVIEIDNPLLSEESKKALEKFLPEFYSH